MRAKIMLLPASQRDETLCDWAEHILIDVSAAFDHTFSLMREKIGAFSQEAYGETLTEETVEACRACRAVFLCDGENSGQELYDALDIPLRIRSLCVPEILCQRHERPANLYVATVLSLDNETLRRAMRVAFRWAKEEDIRLVHVPPTGNTKTDWEAAVRVQEIESGQASPTCLSAPDAIAAMLSSPERMGLVLCPPYAGGIFQAAGTAACHHPGMIHDVAFGDSIGIYSPFLPKRGSQEMNAFSVALAVGKLLRHSLNLSREGACVEAAVSNVLANGWSGGKSGGAEIAPEGVLELICDQITVAGELMNRGGVRP